MMTLLGQWLGFTDSHSNNNTNTTNNNNNSSNNNSTTPSSSSSQSTQPQPASSRPVQPGIVISSPSKKQSASAQSSSSSTPLRKTKSDELLRDFEVMRFLCTVDERLKRQQMVLLPAQLERLQTLQAQAVVDDCPLLIDIIEHFEIEHEKLRHRLACAAPNSAAADAAYSRRNMLVF